MRPLVVKLGGSLAGSEACTSVLAEICAAAAPVVVVPGGGIFADAVRAAQTRHGFSDLAAHRMAILGMAQYGLMLADLAPTPCRLAWGEAAVRAELAKTAVPPVIWLPDVRHDAVELETSWNVTSDTLALWLAGRLGARSLVLVKSCARPPGRDLTLLAEAGVVDAGFPAIASQFPAIAITMIYAGEATALRAALAEAI
jgi:aspartokinase-like uncharacterized kinase